MALLQDHALKQPGRNDVLRSVDGGLRRDKGEFGLGCLQDRRHTGACQAHSAPNVPLFEHAGQENGGECIAGAECRRIDLRMADRPLPIR